MRPHFLEFSEKSIGAEKLLPALLKADRIEQNIPIGVYPFALDVLKKDYAPFYIARDEIEAEEVFEGLKAIGSRAFFFPDIDAIPYSNVFPSADKLADRMNTLTALTDNQDAVIVLTVESLLRKLPPVEFFRKSRIFLETGGNLDREEFSSRLAGMAYIREHKTALQGTFSVRGDIIDIFPPNSNEPVRISLFGDEIESLKIFNPSTQLSIREIQKIEILPASEFALVKENIREEDEEFTTESLAHSYFLRFYNSHSSILEYTEKKPVILYHENIFSQVKNLNEKYGRYESGKEEPLLDAWEKVLGKIKGLKTMLIRGLPTESAVLTGIYAPPEFGEGFSRFVVDLETAYLANNYKVFILVEYDDLAKRLLNILKKFDPVPLKAEEEIPADKRLFIMVLPFEHGFEIKRENENALILTESDISGKKRLFRKRIRQIDTIFDDIEDIQENEPVVHLNYGIGVFKGIQRVNVLGKEKDYILLEFAEREKLFVPLEQSHLIGKYVGGNAKKPPLDSLGSKSWQKKRDRVKASIEEFARKLVAIYAKREALSGHSFAKDTVWQKEFEDKFEYIETPDQIKVVEEIKKDMESQRPMDRLLCGDVGFGKTEVAMRAAFKAVMDGKQAAVIAPTTVLVEQHYYTFIERYKGFPVRIEYISRFTEPGKLKSILARLQRHEIDIIIGTHKLFSEKVLFHSLGLVIIDEEHKFGVNHKEILKERYPLADFLSLSATPIPRTLNMAMATIRDISLLQTPPDMRIPVDTIVSDYTPDLVKYAVTQELARGGQVYFVHNTIKRLAEYAYLLEQMVPGVKVCIGHGQMGEEELDHAFMGFVKGDYNVFVCTTIIDSGLDISNANTIIISDANRFGLSQLYQLKGRVGRAKKQGYAYFLYPQNRALTETAQKRLFVINEYTDLGAGFNIALQDLEIRGAGNILGREQHGNIIAVGYDVYMRLLREEVERLKGGYEEKFETLIDLKYNAFIPSDFIPDSATKMEIYKKILSTKSEGEIRVLSEELHDRFGRVPAEVGTLFEISRLKIKSEKLGIESIIEKGDTIEISFSKYSRVDASKVMGVKAAGKHEISFKPHEKNKIFYKSFDSSITIKVRRLTGFMEDVAEG